MIVTAIFSKTRKKLIRAFMDVLVLKLYVSFDSTFYTLIATSR